MRVFVVLEYDCSTDTRPRCIGVALREKRVKKIIDAAKARRLATSPNDKWLVTWEIHTIPLNIL